MLSRKIDHLVYATNTFEETIDWFEEVSGVRPSFGGYHKSQGTKNALVKIGEICYLEILAVDNDNLEISAPRWMGVDILKEPTLCRWAIQSEDLKADASVLKVYNNEMGQIHYGHRKKDNGDDLNWSMILPLATPLIELAPFVIDWGTSEHPATNLESICQLKALKFKSSNVVGINKLFRNLNIEAEIITSGSDRIIAILETPKGLLEL